MRAVLQRVTRARVLVDGNVTGEIGSGLAVLVAVGREDTAATAASMAEKIVNLRIFSDEQGKMNRSLLEVGNSRCMATRAASAGQASFRLRRPSKENPCMKNLCARCKRSECASLPEFFRPACRSRS